MNLPAIANALTKNFPGQVAVVANDRGSLTVTVGAKSLDVDSEGNVYNIATAAQE